MRDRVTTASVGVSIALHGAFVLVLARRGLIWPRPRAAISIDLLTTHSATPPPATSSLPATAPPSLATIVRRPPSRRGAQHPHPAPPRESAPQVAGEAGPERGGDGQGAPRALPGRADLFASEALAKAVTAPTPQAVFGGHLRRATDPAPQDDERETVAERVHEMVSDLVARERVESGNLPPRWREVERRLAQSFHPPLATVKRENVARAFAHQVIRSWLDGPPRTGTVPRGVDSSVETLLGTPVGFNQRKLPEEQALATQARWGDPASWLRVVVEVTIDADGRILKSRIVVPSGRGAFDRVACREVEAAVRAGGPPDEHRTMTSRWSVEAAVAVAPPTAIGFRFDESGHLSPGATGIRKYLALTHPFQQSVRTHVSLLSIAPRP